MVSEKEDMLLIEEMYNFEVNFFVTEYDLTNDFFFDVPIK